MGSSHAVDITMAINMHRLGSALVDSSAWHARAVLDSGPISVRTRPSNGRVVWEFFAGTARWTQALEDRGFGSLKPIDNGSDPKLDLTSPVVMESVSGYSKQGWWRRFTRARRAPACQLLSPPPGGRISIPRGSRG